MKNYDFNYIVRTRRFAIAFHPISGWLRYGATLKGWLFSFRLRSGYSNCTKRFGRWWQICILGLNIGYVYKIYKLKLKRR